MKYHKRAMKYYRVEPQFDATFTVQGRKWGIWRELRNYESRSDALMHLDSLNRGALMKRERTLEKYFLMFNKVRKTIEKHGTG